MNIDISSVTSGPVFRSLALNTANIWTIQNGTCAVGAVLLVRHNKKVAMIRKAEVEGYSFSGRLAMPGGLIRAVETESFDYSFTHFLFERARRECGIEVETLQHVRAMDISPPPVSGYLAKGQERRTLVIAVEATAPTEQLLHSTDRTIDDAAWFDIPPPWSAMAPANRLIMAKALSSQLSPESKDAAKYEIDEALAKCAAWAHDVGLPTIHHPFAE